MLNEICFGNDKMDWFEEFSNPGNQSSVENSTLEISVENLNLIDSDDGLKINAKESEFGRNMLDKEVTMLRRCQIAKFKALNLMLLLVLLTA